MQTISSKNSIKNINKFRGKNILIKNEKDGKNELKKFIE